MNKTLKLLFSAAGSILALGFIVASFIGGMLFWRFRGAVQPAQAANLSSGRLLWNNDLAGTPQPSQQSTPSNGNQSQTTPWQPGGMMGGWNGTMMGGPWNNNGTQATPQPGYCGGCGMHGWGMMQGWRTTDGQSVVIPQSTPGVDVSFQRDVLPIFNDDCTACHGGTAGLYLDSYANLIQGGRSGAVVVPGDPQSSLLIQYVTNGYMPFRGQRLTNAEIQTLVNWVAAGAKDN